MASWMSRIKKVLYAAQAPSASRAVIALRENIHAAKYGAVRYVTGLEFLSYMDAWIKTFPKRYDLVVGVPRSGLFAAAYVALRLGKPLTTPDLFPDFWQSKSMQSHGAPLHILLIDDSVSTGVSLDAAKHALLKKLGPSFGGSVTTGAVISRSNSQHLPELFHCTIDGLRFFEWNLMHVKGVNRLAVDFDGVLCEEPPERFDRRSEAYKDWIRTARPYLIPDFQIDYILSNRPESVREITEAWLAAQGVKYKELILSKEERPSSKTSHKITELLRLKPDLYWESRKGEAEEIFRGTGLPVLSLEDNRLLQR